MPGIYPTIHLSRTVIFLTAALTRDSTKAEPFAERQARFELLKKPRRIVFSTSMFRRFALCLLYVPYLAPSTYRRVYMCFSGRINNRLFLL